MSKRSNTYSAEMRMAISPQDFGASFKGFLDQVSAAALVESRSSVGDCANISAQILRRCRP
jgi:hypothetical protein